MGGGPHVACQLYKMVGPNADMSNCIIPHVAMSILGMSHITCEYHGTLHVPKG